MYLRQCYIALIYERRDDALLPRWKCMRETFLYSRNLVTPAPGRSRGSRGIAHVDGRSKEGRLLKHIRQSILAQLTANGGEPTLVQKSLAEKSGVD